MYKLCKAILSNNVQHEEDYFKALIFMKNCSICNKEFKHKGTRCNTCVSRIRRYINKKKAVELLGGKCSKCDYNSHLSALQFHHLHSKDFNIGRFGNAKWSKIESEILKCILLCANCHSIEHSMYDDLQGIVPELG